MNYLPAIIIGFIGKFGKLPTTAGEHFKYKKIPHGGIRINYTGPEFNYTGPEFDAAYIPDPNLYILLYRVASRP